MIIYQRMYNRLNIEKMYLSPYIEYQIDDSKIWFYNFESEKVIQLKCKNGKNLIGKFIKGLTQNELKQMFENLYGDKKLAENILTLLIQDKIIE